VEHVGERAVATVARLERAHEDELEVVKDLVDVDADAAAVPRKALRNGGRSSLF